MSRWEGIFLDFYGTLAAGDFQAVHDICQKVVDDQDLDIPAAKLAEMWGHRYFEAIEAVDGHGFRLLLDIEYDTLVETVEPLAGRIDPEPYITSMNNYLARPALFEEVREVLDQRSLPICIVSNADERELRSAMQHHNLQVDHVVSSESAQAYKPEPRIFDAALEITGWSRDRVLHVGDSLHSDVWGAHRAGIKAAWVNRGDRISDIGTEKPDFAWTNIRPIIYLQDE